MMTPTGFLWIHYCDAPAKEKANPRELFLHYLGSNSTIKIQGFTEHLLQDTWNGLLSYRNGRHDSLPSTRRNIGLQPFFEKGKVMKHLSMSVGAQLKGNVLQKWKQSISIVKTSRLFRKKGMTHFSVVQVLLNTLFSISKGRGDKINLFLSSNPVWTWSFISESGFLSCL